MIFELSLAAALILYFVVLIGIPIIVRWTDIANLIGKFLVILRTCMSVQIFIFISCCACKVVKHQTVMVVERFGKFHRACRSDNGFGGTGLHFLIPCMDSPRAIKWRRKEIGNTRATTHEVVMHTVDLREQLMDFEHQKIITRDNVRHDSDPTVAFTKTIPWDMKRIMFSYWLFLPFFFVLAVYIRWRLRCTRWLFSICSTQSVLRMRLLIWFVGSLLYFTQIVPQFEHCKSFFCFNTSTSLTQSWNWCKPHCAPSSETWVSTIRWSACRCFYFWHICMLSPELVYTGLPWRDPTAPSLQN